ncbi:MAG: segregation and condensation protein A [Gallionella sp.]|nr:segregation and condensation protein A [Gallionella sp.]MDP1941979.1 segregation and condensation protein A [Gallionella sp.]
MNTENLSKEQQVLYLMRKILASVVKDTTTKPGMPHPLSDNTIQDIRECFGLISDREAELAELLGQSRNEKPYYKDQPQKTNVIHLHIDKSSD